MIHSNEIFLYFDEFKFYQEIYQVGLTSLMPRKIFYKISTPFLMDSQTANWLDEKLGLAKNSRKRKRVHKGSSSSIPPFLLENLRIVQNAYEKFRSFFGEHIRPSCSIDLHSLSDIGNKEARGWVKNAPIFVPEENGGGEWVDGMEIVNFKGDENRKCKLYRNKSAAIVSSKGHYLLPPNSAYLLGDASSVNHFQKSGLIDFDFIILDPPWPNRTVKRQKTYETMKMGKAAPIVADDPMEKLRQLPMANLLRSDGLLCLWMTNSQTANQQANALIGQWGLRRVAQWHWLKICHSGEAICQFRPEHKLPFESFILACKSDAGEKYSAIPDNHCLISVPNANPSRKPPISILLEKAGFIGRVQYGLELFGRYMLPNFTTVGFEATKFQNEYYFGESEENG